MALDEQDLKRALVSKKLLTAKAWEELKKEATTKKTDVADLIIDKKIVEEDKIALEVGAFSQSQEDYGAYIIYGIPMQGHTTEEIMKEVDAEIVKMQTELISEQELGKLKNIYENMYVNSNASVEGIAENLASYYMLYGDVNLINTEIDIYRSVTREEIREVAKKYLNPNQRLLLDYLPAKDKAQN